MKNNSFMRLALAQAEIAFTKNEVPVGCVIVDHNRQKVIAEAHNKSQALKNPIYHAEIVAINEACFAKQNKILDDCDLYVTLEPCLMCFAAISFARIKRVYYGIEDQKFGAFSASKIQNSPNPNYFQNEYYGGFLEDRILSLMQKFFQNLRKNKF
jgi:cytosine deaminase